nr:hypothetical protein [Tanacetum cinerariifolium]
MALNEYLMCERHRDLARNYTPRKSVSPVRNRILVYPDSDEEDEEYYSLPPLLPCFQTPQPCATFNLVHYNSHNKFKIENMTLEEYARYELAIIGTKNLRKAEHEVPYRYDDKTVDITDYEDSDQEDGELPDLPTFSATNLFASICKQVKEDIGISIMKEKEEVHVEDVQMDEDYDSDHSNTEEMLQWILAKDPFLVCMEVNDQENFMQQITLSSISNKVIKANGLVRMNGVGVKCFVKLFLDSFSIVPFVKDQAPVGVVGFVPQWIGGQIPNNNNGWLEEDPDEDEDADPEEEPEEEEIEDENMVNDEDDEGNEEDDAEFGSNFHIRESSAMRDLAGNSEVYAPGPMCCDLKSVHKEVMKLSKQMHDRYRMEKNMAMKLRQDELHMNGQEFDITALDSAVRENRSKNSKMIKMISEEPSMYTAHVPRADDPYAMVRDAAMDTQGDEDVDTDAPWTHNLLSHMDPHEEPSMYTAHVPRADDPYVMVRDAAMDTQGDEDVDTDAPWTHNLLSHVDPH